jgi:hypothetical protein
MQMWNSFLDYESGGSKEWDKDKMFKEPLYDRKAIAKMCGYSEPTA